MKDGITEVVREKRADGSEPKVGANKTLNVDTNGETKTQTRERHGVAIARARSRGTRMEEKKKEDEGGDNKRSVKSLHEIVHIAMRLHPEGPIEHAKGESRDGINMRVSSQIHARHEHRTCIPDDSNHQEESSLSTRKLRPEPP